jgi:hypothetical protein
MWHPNGQGKGLERCDEDKDDRIGSRSKRPKHSEPARFMTFLNKMPRSPTPPQLSRLSAVLNNKSFRKKGIYHGRKKI